MTRRLLTAFLVTPLVFFALVAATEKSTNVKDETAAQISAKCVNCHLKENRGIVSQWENSEHKVANVGCYSCHASAEGDPMGYNHEGAFIRTSLTPKDCAFCHSEQAKEMTNSHHATAGQITASLDNMLAEVIASFPATKADAVNGCWQCHGSVVKAVRDAKGEMIHNEQGAPVMDWMTWPNSGIGRINYDGVNGSCNACHSRHDFSASRARQPENCGKCHLGPDHPQKEIYEESKHGIAYYAAPKGDVPGGMNIHKRGKWILGKDYNAAPTCSTCHMGGYVKSNGSVVRGTHNVGDRISWTLRPVVSKKLNRVIFEDGSVADVPGDNPPAAGAMAPYTEYTRSGDKVTKQVKDKKIKSVLSWQDRRARMTDVCKNCHSAQHVGNFYDQFDSLVVTYNDKFAKPGASIVAEMKKDKIWVNSGFQDSIGYIWFEIWHHEGRRARHGAAMQGPDYTHWHGMYEVAQHFYTKFIPKVMKMAKDAGKEAKYRKLFAEIIDRPEHEWFKTGGNPATLKAIEEETKRRYK